MPISCRSSCAGAACSARRAFTAAASARHESRHRFVEHRSGRRYRHHEQERDADVAEDDRAASRREYIILDDGSDPGAAVRNIRKLIREDKVDVIVGPNITPAALAALDPVAEYQTPMITLIGSAIVVEPQEGKKVWAFKMAQTDRAMADVMTRYDGRTTT